MNGSGELQTEYSFHVCRGQADVRLDIHSAYAGVRRIADRIFIQCMNGSGELRTEYSFHVCRGQADVRLDIHSAYAGVRWITD